MTALHGPGPQVPMPPDWHVERVETLDDAELEDLVDLTFEAVQEGAGFGWTDPPPPRMTLETFWKGVLLVPQRSLFLARVNGTVVGMAQMIGALPNNQAGAFAAEVSTLYVSDLARHRGLAVAILREIEALALARRLGQLDLHVRADRTAAIALFEQYGFARWGTKPRYALVRGQYLAGHYYSKVLRP
ncbi:GNAT family N-acetyltransferase [Zavarzinia sp. CC-PAN008]|uniref:GNAT family N-acetyltransferase n=1 Tax=Zavarzinia sp. CC-PAN008 TaxID=3243332 RepID=UPI003F742E24